MKCEKNGCKVIYHWFLLEYSISVFTKTEYLYMTSVFYDYQLLHLIHLNLEATCPRIQQYVFVISYNVVV